MNARLELWRHLLKIAKWSYGIYSLKIFHVSRNRLPSLFVDFVEWNNDFHKVCLVVVTGRRRPFSKSSLRNFSTTRTPWIPESTLDDSWLARALKHLKRALLSYLNPGPYSWTISTCNIQLTSRSLHATRSMNLDSDGRMQVLSPRSSSSVRRHMLPAFATLIKL